ncbi:peptidase C1A, partial [Kipferlia bialata]
NNLRTATLLNRLDKSALYGDSPFMDMSQDEFRATYLRPMDVVKSGATPYVSTGPNLSMPSEWDWDAEGYVHLPKNQKDCGGCWAFAVMEAMESNWAIRNDLKDDVPALSAQQLIDCNTENSGCDGGNIDWAFDYVQEKGLESEKHYPYKHKDSKCKYDAAQVDVTMSVDGYRDLPNDEAEIAKALYEGGPVAFAMNATPLQTYTQGIINPKFCSPYLLDHAMLLVGYGHDKPSGLDYWIIMNSWGESWGEGGYFNLVRGVNACGVAEWPVQPCL